MKRVYLRCIISAMLLAAAVEFPPLAMPRASSQSRKPSSDEGKSSLTGRVVDESGQPIPYARLSTTAVNQPLDRYRNTASDEYGRFTFDDLKLGSYKIDVYAGGYCLDGSDRSPDYYRPGDAVTLKIVKGGVITGTVTNSAAEPVIAVAVTAVRLRGLEGRPARSTPFPNERMTDDRGVYRLYGLPPGVYVVMAGGGSGGAVPAYLDDAPTYHPSANRYGAAEVTVQAGQEVRGIDIRYRAERGHTVSGSLSAPEPKGGYAEVRIEMFDSRTGSLAAETYSYARPGSRSFAFHGVADGDYLVRARREPYQGNSGASSPATFVKVKGSDVTGLAIALIATSSIAGSVELQPLTDVERKSRCESKRKLSVEEALVFARSDDKENKKPVLPSFEEPVGAPGEKGDFKIDDLEPNFYRIEARLPGDQWFVRSLTLPAPAKGKPAIDAARDGLAIRPDQQLTGLTIALAEGAATLRGRVVPEKQGATLSKRVRVHLIPAERESADEVLRFSEASAQVDGTFELTSIQPGRYWMLALSSEEDESSDDRTRPRAWDAAVRSKLRSAGETANNAIEFQTCQRMSDQVLRVATNVKLSPNQNRWERRRR